MLWETLRTPAITVERAQSLRERSTSCEKLLWQKLRAKRFHGCKFRRQVPLGPFIVDFLCVEVKLIIEVDGDVHYLPGAKERDKNREDFLRSKGFEILRFGNAQIREGMDGVLMTIRNFLGLSVDAPLPVPLPRGEGTKE